MLAELFSDQTAYYSAAPISARKPTHARVLNPYYTHREFPGELMKTFPVLVLASAIAMVSACSSDDDDNDSSGTDDTTTVAEAGSFQISITNMTTNHLMTAPVVALHDPSVHLFQVGEVSELSLIHISEPTRPY